MSNLSLQPYDHAKVAELDEHAKRLGVMIHIDGVPFGADSAPTSAPSGEPVAWKWKWVDGQTWMLSASEPDDDGLREIKPLYDARSGDNVSTPQSTGLSAIAQERDAGKFEGHTPTPWRLAKGEVHHEGYWVVVADGTRPSTPLARLATWDDPGSKADAELIVAAVNAFTTSPKAISEAPISAEAVKSNDVAEAVERLNGAVELLANTNIQMSLSEWNDVANKILQAASLLESLARERERLREATMALLKVVDEPAGMTPDVVMDKARLGEFLNQCDANTKAAVQLARSALPHPDTKGT